MRFLIATSLLGTLVTDAFALIIGSDAGVLAEETVHASHQVLFGRQAGIHIS